VATRTCAHWWFAFLVLASSLAATGLFKKPYPLSNACAQGFSFFCEFGSSFGVELDNLVVILSCIDWVLGFTLHGTLVVS